MKLFLVLLTACGSIFPITAQVNSAAIQQLRRVNPVSPSVAAEIVRTRSAVLKWQDQATQTTGQPAPDPAAQQAAQRQLEEAQKAAEAAAKQAVVPPNTPMFVSPDQRKHLTDLVTGFYQEVKQQARVESAWEIATIAAVLVLGALGSILSIMKKSTAAAIASALVVVASGLPKLFPIHDRAVYYRTLTNQSYSLMGSLQIPFQMTTAEYDDGAARLKVLDDYRGTKYPETANVDTTTQDLLKDLNAVKTEPAEQH